MTNIIKRLKAIISECVWNIGITSPIKLSENEHNVKVNWIKGVSHCNWYADPFILSYDDNKIDILVEEYIAKEDKGVISQLVVDLKTLCIIESTKILELDTHLSFPLIFRDNGKIYIMPENYQSGQLTLYEYDVTSKHLINPTVILNEAVVDSSILKFNNIYYIFTTKYSLDFCGGAHDIHIYKSENITGPYQLHQTITLDAPIARGAGSIIQEEENIYIPTQNCQERYGQQVVLQQLCFNNSKFHIKEISRISPLSPYNKGCHTYNQLGEFAVIDGYKYKYGKIAELISIIYKLLIK